MRFAEEPLSETGRQRAVLVVAWAALAVVWLFLQRASFALLPGDEGIYVYDGLLTSRGLLPYRDYFLAHPPLRVLLAALMFLLSAGPAAVKSVALVATVLASLLVGLAVTRRSSTAWGVLAVGLYLFSLLAVCTGGQLVGSNVGALFVAAALLLATTGRFLGAGVALAVGATQALYIVIPAPVLLVWAMREGRARRFLLGLALAIPLFGLLFAVFGRPFADQVLLYHLRKVVVARMSYPVEQLLAFLYGEAGLLAFSLAALLDRSRTSRFLVAGAFFTALVIASYQSPMTYYFTTALPFLVASAALGLRELQRTLAGGGGARRGVAAAVLGVMLVVTYLPHVLHAVEYGEEVSETRAEADAIVAGVAARPPDSGLLFGTTNLVPLAALLTGLEVAGREVDTNTKRIYSGMVDPRALVEHAFAGPPPGVLLIMGSGLSNVDEILHYLMPRMERVFEHEGAMVGRVVYLLPRE